MKAAKYLLLALVFAALLSLQLALASTPNPGHDASSIGNGTFDSGNFTFPDNLSVGNNFFVNGSANIEENLFIRTGQNITLGSTGAFITETGGLLSLASAGGTNIVLNPSSSVVNLQGNLRLNGIQPRYIESQGGGGPRLYFNDDTDSIYATTGVTGFGVLTANPTQALDVNGSINISDASGALYTPEICLNGDCQTSWPAGAVGGGGWTNNSENTSTTLNVGIGTSTPAVPLDVVGGIRQQVSSADLQEVGFITDGGGGTTLNLPVDVFVAGKYAYVTSENDDGLSIIDVSDPTSLTEVGTITDIERSGSAMTLDGPRSVFVSGKYAYVTSFYDDGLSIIDVSEPTNPIEVGYINDSEVGGTATTLDAARGVFVSGGYAYVASYEDHGLSIIDVSDPTSPVEVGFITDSSVGGTASTLREARTLYVAGALAYVVSGGDNGISIIDVSDPTSPVEVGFINDSSVGGTATALSGPRRIKVSDRYAYVTSGVDNALSIIDVSDPTSPTEVGTVVDTENGGSATILDGAWGLFVSGNYAYVNARDDDGLSIIDISDPTSPTEVGTITDGGAATTLNGAINLYVSGGYAYAASFDDNGLSVIDLAGIDAPTAQIGSLETGNFLVEMDAEIGNQLIVGSDLQVGPGGIYSQGKLFVQNDTKIQGDANISGTLRTPELCLNGDCQTTWPTGDVTGSGSANYLAAWTSSSNLVHPSNSDQVYSVDGALQVYATNQTAFDLLHRYDSGVDFQNYTAMSVSLENLGLSSSYNRTFRGMMIDLQSYDTMSLGDDYLVHEGIRIGGSGSGSGDETFYGVYIDPNTASYSQIYSLYAQAGDVFINDDVGIGTRNPTQALDVNGSINISNASGVLYAPEICLNGDCQTTWPTGGSSAGGWTNSSTLISSNVGDNITMDSGTLYVDATNNRVGIGSVTPLTALYVAKENGNAIQVDNDNASTWSLVMTNSGQTSGSGFYVDAGNELDLRLRNTSNDVNVLFDVDGFSYVLGDFGVGTNSPTGRLQVTGDEVRIGNAGTVDLATGDGDLYVEDQLEVDGNASIGGSLTLASGASVNEISTDGTLGDDSDTAVPTEQAVRTFVESQVAGSNGGGWTNTSTLISSNVGDNITMDGGVFYVDATNNRVGVNTTSPGYPFDINGNAGFRGDLVIASGNSAYIGRAEGGSPRLIFGTSSISTTGTGDFLWEAGGVEIGTGTPGNATGAGDLYVTGDIEYDGNIYGPGADIAEIIPSTVNHPSGSVVSIVHSDLVLSTQYDVRVAGIVTTDPGIVLSKDTKGTTVALAGRVPVNIHPESHHIYAGDRLVAAENGMAMKLELHDLSKAENLEELALMMSENALREQAIIGKALEDWDGSAAQITVLVQ